MSQATLGFRAATRDAVGGTLALAVARQGHRTRPVTTEASGIFRLMQPLYLDDSGQVTYILMSSGGAYFGETYRVAVDVQPGAHLLVSSQSATRIYKTPVAPAVQEAAFTLGAGSRLEYIPDQTIAYRNADYRQYTKIVTGPDAQAFFGEIVTPGWDPEDLKFTYAGMHLRIDVHSADGAGLVLVDNVRIQPAAIGDAIDGIGYMEGRTHMGSVLILGAHTRGDYRDEVRAIVERFETVRAGVSGGSRHGVSWLMVRALGDSTDTLRDMILTVNAHDRAVTTGQARLDLRRY